MPNETEIFNRNVSDIFILKWRKKHLSKKQVTVFKRPCYLLKLSIIEECFNEVYFSDYEP